MGEVPRHSGGASESGRSAVFVDGASAGTDEHACPPHLIPAVHAILAGHSIPTVPEQDTAVLAALLALHRLDGLGYEAARDVGNHGLMAALEPPYRRQQLAGAMVQESAERAVSALGEADVPVLVFKGAGLIRQGIYPNGGTRPMDDADLLVSPYHASRAVEVLCAAGFEPWYPWKTGREGWSDSFSLQDSSAPAAFPCHIDLHWRTEYGALRFGSGGSILWEDADTRAQVPSPEAHLLVVAEHLLKHLRVRPHLLAYADLHRLSGAIRSWEAFIGLARGRWWTAAVGALLQAMREELSTPVPAWVSDRLIATRPAVRRAANTLRPSRHLGHGATSGSRMSGVGQRWRLGPGSMGVAKEFWGVVFPPLEWLRSRYGAGSGLGLRVRHGQAVLRWASGTGASPLSPNQEPPPSLDSQQGKRVPGPVDTPVGRV